MPCTKQQHTLNIIFVCDKYSNCSWLLFIVYQVLLKFWFHSDFVAVGYQISYRLDVNDPTKFTTVEVGSNARQFTVTGLNPESAYVFQITARTQQGWGPPEEAIVITTEKRGKEDISRNVSEGIVLFGHQHISPCIFYRAASVTSPTDHAAERGGVP